MNTLPTIHALWIGEKLGKMASQCLLSFVKQGHTVHLHTYGEILDLPTGITVCDANNIIHHSKIIKHRKTGSYALFSDIFRYELLKKVDGIYVDCDVYCLKPLSVPEHGYLFGYEEDGRVNGAILALPKDSPLLATLIHIAYDTYFIPPWYSKKTQRRFKIKKLLGQAKHIGDMPWGVIGPDAITYYVNQLGLDGYAQDIDIFYPVHFNCISQLLNPVLRLDDITTSRTQCIHLYNEMLRQYDISTLNNGSVLANILQN